MSVNPICDYCIHSHKNNPDIVKGCEAFPDGIPQDILDWFVSHNVPYPGDRGIRFEPIKGFDPETGKVNG